MTTSVCGDSSEARAPQSGRGPGKGRERHPSQDPGVPFPNLLRALREAKTRRRGIRALQTKDVNLNRADTAKPVPPSSRTPITDVKNERVWAEDSNSRRGKPRSKRRFYLAFSLTKLSKIGLSTVMGWTKKIASFVATAKMFCARASARLRPAPHTQYSLGGAGPQSYRGPGKGDLLLSHAPIAYGTHAICFNLKSCWRVFCQRSCT